MKRKQGIGILKWIIPLIFILPVVLTEFRFCFKGPHRMTELDCPGGFFSKDKINLTCKYFARTKNVSTAQAKFTPDVCDIASTYSIDVLSHNEDDLSGFPGDALQKIMFEVDESIIDGEDTGGKIDPEDVCETSCLEGWEEPGHVDDEEFIDDGTGTPNNVNSGQELVALQLNLEIFLSIMDEDEKEGPKKNDIFTNDLDDGEGLRVLKLLAKSMRIATAGCEPFVDEGFFREVFKAFIYVASKNESLVQDVTTDEYKNINQALNRCLQKRNLGFYLNGTVCDGYAKVDGVHYFRSDEYWKYRQTGYTARWPRHNPFIEASWNAIEFVHGYCFEAFVDNIMDLHTYEMAVEGLFTAMVLRHWQVPVVLKQEIFWNNVLNTRDVKQTMKNLDACVVAGTKMSPFTKRLERPYVGQEAAENPKPDKTYPWVTEEKKVGWNNTIEKYWEWYEKKGGFKAISKNFGVCVDKGSYQENKDAIEEVVVKYQEVACPDMIDVAPPPPPELEGGGGNETPPKDSSAPPEVELSPEVGELTTVAPT